jgi:hypothetical protein
MDKSARFFNIFPVHIRGWGNGQVYLWGSGFGILWSFRIDILYTSIFLRTAPTKFFFEAGGGLSNRKRLQILGRAFLIYNPIRRIIQDIFSDFY